MVKGIESFKEKFKDYTDCYTVIGGTACDILMTEANQEFRATKDIDMILILEDGIHIETSGMIRDDIESFISSMSEEQINLSQLGLPYNKDQALEMLRGIYL